MIYVHTEEEWDKSFQKRALVLLISQTIAILYHLELKQ